AARQRAEVGGAPRHPHEELPDHLRAHRRRAEDDPRPDRAGVRGAHARPRRGQGGHPRAPRRQHRRLLRPRGRGATRRQGARPPRRQGGLQGLHRRPEALQGRRARGGHRLRVRYQPPELRQHPGGRHHRGLRAGRGAGRMNRASTGILILAAVLASVLYLWQPWAPGQSSLKLGLDLQGGLRVTLQSEQPDPLREDLSAARDIIENRVNQFGVAEALVQTSGDRNIVVELPGLTAEDQQRALDLIGQQAVLEFKLVRRESEALFDEELTPADLEPTAFTGEIISNATAAFAQGAGMPGGPTVNFTVRPEFASQFGQFTGNNLGRRMAIVLDDVVITAPRLQDRISTVGQITGIATLDAASDIAVVLRSGSLPISLQVAEVRSIGPTLGQDAINAGTTAAVVGGVAVIVAVVLYYGPLFGGVLAFGVMLAMLFIFGALAGLGASLTLPGIAGLVLTIG